MSINYVLIGLIFFGWVIVIIRNEIRKALVEMYHTPVEDFDKRIFENLEKLREAQRASEISLSRHQLPQQTQ